MDGGVVVEQGNPRSVINNPQNERTRTFLQRMHSEHKAQQADLEHPELAEHREGTEDVPDTAAPTVERLP